MGFTDSAPAICWSDALGQAAFAVLGCAIGFDAGATPLISVICGLMSASFGGMIRDNLCAQKPRLLHANRSMYGTPAILGSVVCCALINAGHKNYGMLIGFFLCLGLRVYAFTYKITSLPGMHNIGLHLEAPTKLAATKPVATAAGTLDSQRTQASRS